MRKQHTACSSRRSAHEQAAAHSRSTHASTACSSSSRPGLCLMPLHVLVLVLAYEGMQVQQPLPGGGLSRAGLPALLS